MYGKIIGKILCCLLYLYTFWLILVLKMLFMCIRLRRPKRIHVITLSIDQLKICNQSKSLIYRPNCSSSLIKDALLIGYFSKNKKKLVINILDANMRYSLSWSVCENSFLWLFSREGGGGVAIWNRTTFNSELSEFQETDRKNYGAALKKKLYKPLIRDLRISMLQSISVFETTKLYEYIYKRNGLKFRCSYHKIIHKYSLFITISKCLLNGMYQSVEEMFERISYPLLLDPPVVLFGLKIGRYLTNVMKTYPFIYIYLE